MISNFYRNKTVLITGHTGFKGAWLSLVLHSFGAKVHGISLKPYDRRGNLYKICLLYTSPSPRDATLSRMPSSA